MEHSRHASTCILALGFSTLLAGCAQQQPAGMATASTPAPLATKPTVGQEVGAVVQNQVVVTFPTGGYRLSRESDGQLDLAARLFRDVNPVAMFTEGYTDGSGDELSNIHLAALRAEAVKQGLVARGIPAERLRIQAFGASELANAQDPLAPENRRVVIKWRLL